MSADGVLHHFGFFEVFVAPFGNSLLYVWRPKSPLVAPREGSENQVEQKRSTLRKCQANGSQIGTQSRKDGRIFDYFLEDPPESFR